MKTLGLACGGLLLLAATALADPQPLDPTPKPPARFPMSSTQFRPLFDKAVAQMEAVAAKARTAEDRSKMQAVISHARIQASIAMEDGVVTRDEAMHIFTDRNRF